MSEIKAELFNQPNAEFTEHLNIPNNERIIFSAKFGMGKTTFLKWFFEQDENKAKYNVIHLFPVNYSVASNEDIFRYIKYDIITELLEKQINIPFEEIKSNEVLKQFLKKNSDKVLAGIISMLPILGKQVLDSYDRIRPLFDSFSKIKEELNAENNVGDVLVNFLEEIEKEDGNIFEDNIITRIIEDILKQNEGNNKGNVLIIDDLDRIDPEHIFRLLNIFAAHFDRTNPTKSKNKFGFDKVIFVCDIENIREIFRHKYGLNVDFNGYIDKFFSNTVYNFLHTNNYPSFIYSYINHIQCYGRNYSGYKIPLNNNGFLKFFIDICINSNVFDLRNVIKWDYLPLMHENSFTIDSTHKIRFEDHGSIFTMRFLHDIKGNVDGLLSVLNFINSRPLKQPTQVINGMCGELVLLMNYKSYGKDKIAHKIADKYYNFYYDNSSHIPKLIKVEDAERLYSSINLTDDNFMTLLYETVKFMADNNMFK